MRKLKTGDDVIVLAGKDKGKQGKLIKIAQDKKRKKRGLKVLVEGVNMVKKHVRPNPNANEKGGIREREAFIDISNVAILNPTTKKADRVGFKTVEESGAEKPKKVRYFKSNGEVIDI